MSTMQDDATKWREFIADATWSQYYDGSDFCERDEEPTADKVIAAANHAVVLAAEMIREKTQISAELTATKNDLFHARNKITGLEKDAVKAFKVTGRWRTDAAFHKIVVHLAAVDPNAALQQAKEQQPQVPWDYCYEIRMNMK